VEILKLLLCLLFFNLFRLGKLGCNFKLKISTDRHRVVLIYCFHFLCFFLLEWCYSYVFKLLVMGLWIFLLLDLWFYTHIFVYVCVLFFLLILNLNIHNMVQFVIQKIGFPIHTLYPDSTILRISALLVVITLLLSCLHVFQFACFTSQVCSVVDSAELCRHTHPDRFSSCYHYYY